MPEHSTDLYALGIVFFELLTGRRPSNWQSLEDVRNLRNTETALHPSGTGRADPSAGFRPHNAGHRSHKASAFRVGVPARPACTQQLHQWFCKQSAADVALIPMVESRLRMSRIEVSSPVTSLEANDPARWEKDGDYCRLRRTGDAKRRAR